MIAVTTTTIVWLLVLGIILGWGKEQGKLSEAADFGMGFMFLVAVGLVIGNIIVVLFL